MNSVKLVEVLRSAGFEPENYSGRGMYGRECVGVTISRGQSTFNLAAQLCVEAIDLFGEEEGPDFIEELSRLSVSEDSMGHDSIVYFPRVSWPASADESHDCEGSSCCTPAHAH